MIQILFDLQFFSLLIIIAGILLLIIGVLYSIGGNDDEHATTQRETKAIVFIGPIPLVWGFSRRTQVFLAIVALSMFFFMLVLFAG